MIHVSVYDLATGKILRRAMLDPDMIEANISAGEGWVEGFYDLSKFTIQGGQPVAIGDDQIEAAAIQAAWVALRMARGSLLSACDWTQVPDAPVDHAAWAAYRQALRDLPANTTDPRHPVWPTPPA